MTASAVTANPLLRASWPEAELGAAVSALAAASGLLAAPSVVDGGPDDGTDAESWMADAAARLGVEIVAVSVRFGDLGDMLRKLGPALLRLPDGRWLVVLRGGRRLRLLGGDGRAVALGRDVVHDELCARLLAPAVAAAREVFAGIGLAAENAAIRAFAAERIGETEIPGCWLVRPSPASPLLGQARAAQAPLLVATLLVARVASTLLLLVMWWLVGRDVLSGELARSSLGLWAMCLLSIIPLRMLDAWAQSRLALASAGVLKEALLHGILHLERGAMRAYGVGQFMSIAMESEIAASAAMSALAVVAAVIDLVAAMVVLALGVAGAVHMLLLLAWIAATAWLIRRYVIKAVQWTTIDRDVTNDLVERLVGYQTRLVQEQPARRHDDEDVLLQRYLAASQQLDRRGLALSGIVRPGWILLGIAALVPSLLAGGTIGATTSVAIGGVLMVAAALTQVTQGVVHMADVYMSWQQTAPLLAAGRRGAAREAEVRTALAARPPARTADAAVLRFTDLSLRHGPDRPEVLRGCTQAIAAGDRVLLEGSSGGGKSSLATVLAGLHAPTRGGMWLRGEPFAALPPELWRGRVVLVPQFHDNHVMTDTLLFNLLLGRRWPPSNEDSDAAEQVCDLLGLRPLLQRMPQGLAQTVGDGGWALSHGERSRVFLARALLQKDVAVVILDESFGALDPETLRSVSRGVLAAAPTLLVIAHP